MHDVYNVCCNGQSERVARRRQQLGRGGRHPRGTRAVGVRRGSVCGGGGTAGAGAGAVVRR